MGLFPTISRTLGIAQIVHLLGYSNSFPFFVQVIVGAIKAESVVHGIQIQNFQFPQFLFFFVALTKLKVILY